MWSTYSAQTAFAEHRRRDIKCMRMYAVKSCIAQLHLCSQPSLLQAVITQMSVAQIAEVQELVRQVGLAPTKAKNICNMSKVYCCGCFMSNVCFCSDVL